MVRKDWCPTFEEGIILKVKLQVYSLIVLAITCCGLGVDLNGVLRLGRCDEKIQDEAKHTDEEAD